jgi:hypothetical protein
LNLLNVVGRILAPYEINIAETVFSPNHQILNTMLVVVSKQYYTVTSNGQFALIKKMTTFAAIVA